MKIPLVLIFLTLSLHANLGQLDKKTCPILDVSLAELEKNSDAFDNCRVRVRGEYLNDEDHNSIVLRDHVARKILVDFHLDFIDDSDIVKEYRGINLIEFAKIVTSGELNSFLKDISWVIPLPVKPVPANQLKAISRISKKKRKKPIEILIVGRFDYAGKGRLILHQDGHTSFVAGFGNWTRWRKRIVVETIVIQKSRSRSNE